MKISYNWLKQYIDLDLTPQDYVERVSAVNLVCVGSCTNLTEVSILLTQVVQVMPEASFIYIDLLSPIFESNGYAIAGNFMGLVKQLSGELDLSCFAMLPEADYENPDLDGLREISTKIVYAS